MITGQMTRTLGARQLAWAGMRHTRLELKDRFNYDVFELANSLKSRSDALVAMWRDGIPEVHPPGGLRLDPAMFLELASPTSYVNPFDQREEA